MTNPPYPSPLAGYEAAAAQLTDDRNNDGKSLRNTQTGVLSPAYSLFPSPLDNGIRGGLSVPPFPLPLPPFPPLCPIPPPPFTNPPPSDVHIYHVQTAPDQVQYSKDLWARIRLEFPELRIYRRWDQPIGPHPVGMFEVNLSSPAEFGAFVPWLVVWRGPLSALVHPNSTETDVEEGVREERNHVERAFWLGERWPLVTGIFKGM